MRRRVAGSAPLAERVWRAVAVGFTLTAIALNALAPTLSRQPISGPKATATGASRRASVVQPVLETRHSNLPRERNDSAQPPADLASLTRRFREAPDADLTELASALASLGGPGARDVLFSAARSSRVASVTAALQALSNIDTPDVREFMLAQLNRKDPPLEAVAYFEDCREPRALPALEQLARASSLALRDAVIASLFAQGAEAEPVISRLLQMDDELADALLGAAPTTTEARRALRRASVQRLRAGSLTQGAVFDFLAQDQSSEGRDALEQAAHDPGSVTSALAALSKRGDPASLTALQRLANDSDRDLAVRATCRLRVGPNRGAFHFGFE
ncbi:MAG TPA: hypothetical protein VER96_12270 [Polyangiaceae bacterium]|nr:hypothetical protein [Polyangiaceae bacterium]